MKMNLSMNFPLWLTVLAALILNSAYPQDGAVQETQEDLAFLEETIEAGYKGGYRRSAEDLEEYLYDYPDSVRALESLAFVQRMRGRYEEALEAAERWSAIQPASSDARIELGRNLALLGRFDEAEARFREAFDAAPSTLKTRYHLAGLLFDRGRREEARSLAREAVKLHPPEELDGDGLYHLCLLYHILGDLEKAAVAGVYADKHLNGLVGPKYRFARYEALLALGGIYLKTRVGNQGSGQRALNCYQDILKRINERLPEALLGMARTKYYASEYTNVLGRLDEALAVNPAHAGALALKAHVLTLFRQYDKALEAVRKGLDVNPGDKGLLAQEGAVLLLNGDEEGHLGRMKAALEQDPFFGEAYYRVAELLIYHYRFPEAEAYLRKCMEIDPEFHEAYVLLARTLANLGREAEAKEALLESLKRDPYAYPWRHNMLEVLTELDGFLEVDSDLFKLMLDAEEAPVMRRYLQRLGRESVSRLREKYGFDVKTPILMEMFPDHRDFAVRTIGFTGLGALGACFGEVVTLLSPRAMPFRGQFSWLSTLHHELCHAFTLQMSRYRIPRWLTEGVSVFEEEALSPYWRRNMDMDLFNAYHNGRLFTLENFDSGFMSPRVLFAYYQAGLTVKFIVDRFGIEGLGAMIRAYGDDLGTPAIVRQVFGLEPGEFEDAFKGWIWHGMLHAVECRPFHDAAKMHDLVDAARGSPDDVDALLDAAWACFRNGSGVDALFFLNKVKALQPEHGSGYLLQGEMAFGKKDTERAERYYLEAMDAGIEDLFAFRNLAMIARGRGDVDQAVEYLKQAKACFPSFIDPGSPRLILAEIYTQAGRPEDAAREMEELLDQGAQDIHLFIKVGRHYSERDEPGKAAAFLEAAIHIDPFRKDIHAAFAQELRKLSRHLQALEELDLALEIEPAPEAPLHQQMSGLPEITDADIHAEKGANLLAMGNREEALEEIEEALKLQSGHPLAEELKKKLEPRNPEEL